MIVFGIVSWHPDNTTEVTGRPHHVINSRSIQATYCPVERNAAVYAYSGHNLRHEICSTRCLGVMILEHNRAHAGSFCVARRFQCIDGTRHTVGRAVHMDVDHAFELRIRNTWKSE